jgi:hypothetical protein
LAIRVPYRQSGSTREEAAVVADEVVALRVPGLSKAERLELAEFLEPGAVSFEDQRVPEGSLGEITLATAVIIASAMALKGFVAYLVYRWKDKEDVLELDIEEQRADGTRLKKRLRVRRTEGERPEDAIARELGSPPGLPGIFPVSPGGGPSRR